MVSEMCWLVTVFNPCVWGLHPLTHFLYSENDLVKSVHHQVCLSTLPSKSAPVKVCEKRWLRCNTSNSNLPLRV